MPEQDMIMVVDDDPTTLELLVDILSVEGFQVRASDNGETALEAVTNEKPKLILLDINMPVKTGMEALKEIQALSA